MGRAADIMKICVLCDKDIAPGTKTVELAGGFFDPADPEFFAMEDSVLSICYLHLDCLSNALSRAKHSR